LSIFMSLRHPSFYFGLVFLAAGLGLFSEIQESAGQESISKLSSPATLPSPADEIAQAKALFKQGDVENAFQISLDAALRQPNDRDAWLTVAVAALKSQHRWEGYAALRRYRRDAVLDPQQTRRLDDLAQALTALPPTIDADEAVAQYQAQDAYQKMQMALQDGDQGSAKVEADKAIARFRRFLGDPRAETVDAWNELAGSILVSDDKTLAPFAVEAIRRLDPNFFHDSNRLAAVAKLTDDANTDQIGKVQSDRYDFELRCLRSAHENDSCGPCLTRLADAYSRGLGTFPDSRRAVSLLKSAANLQYVPAMEQLSRCYETGSGVNEDYTRAMAWSRRAADAGDTGAMKNIGQLYLNGLGVEKDYVQAVSWIRRAADGGDAEAMFSLGQLYLNGLGVEKDYVQAVSWILKAADGGDGEAMYTLGQLYDSGRGVEADRDQAVFWYHRAADTGNVDGMYSMAKSYDGAKDYAHAIAWYQKAADAGCTDAMRDIGAFYINGWGVDKDYSQGMEWSRKAADRGNAGGMFNVGKLFVSGWGVDQDYTQAMSWYCKAADAGNSAGMEGIGLLYESGWGVKQDYGQALNWYRKAADVGDANAIYRLCQIYTNGLGVKYGRPSPYPPYLPMRIGWEISSDMTQARFWARKGAAIGNADCEQWLNDHPQ
jgi:TPR repeat protein